MTFLVTETELAYAAGLLDGEGHLSIRTRPNQKKVRYHTVAVSVSNTDLRPLVWLQERFGGSVREYRHKHGSPHHKPVHIWQVNTLAAEQFLRAVRPYLIIKQEQAELVLQLRDRAARQKKWAPLPDGEFEAREEIRLQLRALTKRGV